MRARNTARESRTLGLGGLMPVLGTLHKLFPRPILSLHHSKRQDGAGLGSHFTDGKTESRGDSLFKIIGTTRVIFLMASFCLFPTPLLCGWVSGRGCMTHDLLFLIGNLRGSPGPKGIGVAPPSPVPIPGREACSPGIRLFPFSKWESVDTTCLSVCQKAAS